MAMMFSIQAAFTAVAAALILILICPQTGEAIPVTTTNTATLSTLQHKNPVWTGYLADPFVLHVGEDYYAYGTAELQPNKRFFPVLKSKDLIHWTDMGGSLI